VNEFLLLLVFLRNLLIGIVVEVNEIVDIQKIILQAKKEKILKKFFKKEKKK